MGRFLQLPAAVIAIVSSHSLQPWKFPSRKKMNKIKFTERLKDLIGFQSQSSLQRESKMQLGKGLAANAEEAIY
jgi:hypothetical protein